MTPRVVGCHPVEVDEPVHLIEIEVDAGFDFGAITQELAGQPERNWQVAYDEQPVGDHRFVFFFHYLDTSKPLLSPFGPLDLPPESPMPLHLSNIEYKQP